jgi:hypothetical protein
MQRWDVCLPLATRRCDVGLDKVSHQQIQPSGWLSGESDTAPGLTMSPGGAAQCAHGRLGRVPASRIHSLQYNSCQACQRSPRDSAGIPARKHLRAPRQPRQGGCTPSRTIVHGTYGVARDVPFLGASKCRRGTDIIVPFFFAAGRRVFLVLRVHLCS